MIIFNAKRAILFSVLLAATISLYCLCGCKGNGPNYFPPYQEPPGIDPIRPSCEFAPANPDGSSRLNGVTPYTFFVVSNISMGDGLYDQEGEPLIPTVEIDFSDGTGWHDYTAETLEFYRGERAWEDMPTYTLANPGEYPIHVRMVFPNGVVIDNDDFWESFPEWQIITVLPADDDGGGEDGADGGNGES
ncbi:hypothetical protein J7K50_00075 [bacterium]|nr:hypothetical protein [bacterium]